jgi:hypothetical protein
MRYHTYKLYVVSVYFAIILALTGLIAVAISLRPNPDYAPAIGFLVGFTILGAIASYVSFAMMDIQLDRHGGSIPMPGLAGVAFDIEDEDADDSTAADFADTESGVSGRELVRELEPDAARDGSLTPPVVPSSSSQFVVWDGTGAVTCPECGTTEPASGSHFCRKCGASLGWRPVESP